MNLIHLARRCHGELSRLYQKHVWKPETSNCTPQHLWDIMFVPALDTCFWYSTPKICHDSHAILIIYVCEDRKQWVWPPICLLIWTSSSINSERLGIWNGCYVRIKFGKIWVCDEFRREILYYNRPRHQSLCFCDLSLGPITYIFMMTAWYGKYFPHYWSLIRETHLST